MTHRNQPAKCRKNRACIAPDVAARQYLFNRGRDWFLLKPSVRAVWLALRVLRG